MTDPIDPQKFRRIMGQVPTTVTVVTAAGQDHPVAMVIGSFVSVSLDPPLVGFFCTTESTTWHALRDADVIGINVLAADQDSISNACMRSPEERLQDLDWTMVDGAPQISGTSAWITAAVDQVVDAGDHEFALCAVKTMETPDEPAEPLIFWGGGYRTLEPKADG